MTLRLAVLLAHHVTTAAPESLRIRSRKVHVIGHGTDTSLFKTERTGSMHEPSAIITVGRITPIKRLDIAIKAVAQLRRKGKGVRLTVAGAPTVVADHAYAKELTALVLEQKVEEDVTFIGAVPYEAMPAAYRAHDLSLNLAPTGGIDKAVLESMASGCIVLTTNRAFKELFGPLAEQLIVPPNPAAIAERLEYIVAMQQDERRALSEHLMEIASRKADVSAVLERLYSYLS